MRGPSIKMRLMGIDQLGAEPSPQMVAVWKVRGPSSPSRLPPEAIGRINHTSEGNVRPLSPVDP